MSFPNIPFIEFLVSRTDLFLARYMPHDQVADWRLMVEHSLLPEWRDLQLTNEPKLKSELSQFLNSHFGVENLPTLRRRFSSHRHRQKAKTKAVDLDLDAYNALNELKNRYRLTSNSEAILWLIRELDSHNLD